MSVKLRAFAISSFTIALYLASQNAVAEQWYFYVENSSSASIKGLYASEDGKSWGRFDIGSGIAAGQTVKLSWDKSTNSQSCDQQLKAVFADGSEVKTAKMDFCHDLDNPVVFN